MSRELEAWREAFETLPDAAGQTQLWLRDPTTEPPAGAEALAGVEAAAREAACELAIPTESRKVDRG